MTFRLEIDLDALQGDAATEAERICRYRGGAMNRIDLTQHQSQEIYDSTHAQPVGAWSIETSGEPFVNDGETAETMDKPDD